MGTRGTLLCINLLNQRCLVVSKTLNACFINYNNAFGKAHFIHIIQLLRNQKMDLTDIILLTHLHFNRTDIDERGEKHSELVQSCVFSPQLYCLYSASIK